MIKEEGKKIKSKNKLNEILNYKLVTIFIELLRLDILAYILALTLVYALCVIDSTSIWFKFSQLNYDQLNTLKKKVQNIKVSKVVPFIKW